MSVRSALLALLAALLLAGCSGGSATRSDQAGALPSGSSPSSQASAGSPTTASGASPASSGGIGDFTVGGDRPVTVHVPAGHDPDVPAPLLMLLHGYGVPADEQEAYMRLGPVAAARGMLYLRPEGTVDTPGFRFWDATDACCDIDGTGVDDSSYLAGLIAEVGTHVAVDPRRVFVVGHSNGAFMSYRMACDHADLIAAIVSLAGASYGDRAACHPSEPLAVLEIHGSDDAIVRVGGGNLKGLLAPGDVRLADYPSTEASLAAWAGYDGCTGRPDPKPGALDLDRVLRGANGPNETTISAYTGCVGGGSVELWMIEGGGHDPELTADFGATVIDFLLAHPKSR